jgi:hypothetical protein
MGQDAIFAMPFDGARHGAAFDVAAHRNIIVGRQRTGDALRCHISTSLVVQQNLTMRMQMRRFTRLINGLLSVALKHCPRVGEVAHTPPIV